MVPRDTAREVVDTVVTRIDLLEHLANGPTDKRTLEGEVAVSRSTVDRAVRELEVLGLVEYRRGGYTVTPVGDLVTAECTALLETVGVALDLEAFLRWLPLAEFDLDIRLLADAELLIPTPDNPYAMIDRHVERLREADHGRGILPITGLHAAEAAHESIVGQGADGEWVVEPGVAEIVLSDPSFAGLTAEMLETGRLDLKVFDGTIPYFVGVFDDETVQIGVDEGGEPRAIVETDRDGVRAWAHETIDWYVQQATALSQPPVRDPVAPAADE